MDFALTPAQEILRRSAREFLEAECPTSLVREAAESGEGHWPELWRRMAALGWLGIALPDQYGGTGGTLTDQTVLFEEIGRALTPGPLLTSSALAARVVLNVGNENQKDSLLPGVVSGDLILTLARGDRLETANKDGGLTLSGESSFVPHARLAHQIVCATRPAIGAWPDTTLVLVDSQASGVAKTPMESIANYPQCVVEFDDVALDRRSVGRDC